MWVCVCMYAHTCAVGMFNVLVLVHFKGEADENSTEYWVGGARYSWEGWSLSTDWHSQQRGWTAA